MVSQLIVKLEKPVIDPDEIKYKAKVNSARKYLRNRDFMHYAPSLVPEPLGSETWSLAWAYIREIDDILDAPGLPTDTIKLLLYKEKQVILDIFNNEFMFRKRHPLRYLWLWQFFKNQEKYYDNQVKDLIWELYESAKMDIDRRYKILTNREMDRLVYKKAVIFFKLYFTLSRLDIGKYIDELSYDLGKGLGIIDDALDFLLDYRSGYINVTKEELEILKVDMDPMDRKFVDILIKRGYYTLKAVQVMRLFLRARQIARHIKNKLLRNYILRLTEIFGAPIIEGRLIPGEKYFIKGGEILNKLLPDNEDIAYKIGHKLMAVLLSIPQVSPTIFQGFLKSFSKLQEKFFDAPIY